ncbi:RBMX2 protein, partial [Amia calva]|nr:RBMX2 protein [Amia calva]
SPLTKVKLINELNQREAELGVKETVSWHSEYKDSAWIFIGGFPYELTEGDLLCIFSQYGEIANINLVRDKKTGKSKGFCFICYEDQRSTILAVDNFNGIKIKGRTMRVDHVANYRPPKDSEDIDDVTKQLREQGCAPRTPPPPSSESEEGEYTVPVKKQKKEKKEKKKKKKEKKDKKKKKEEEERGSSPSAPPSPPPVRVKTEKQDLGYEKYASHPEDRPARGDRRRDEELRPGGERGEDRVPRGPPEDRGREARGRERERNSDPWGRDEERGGGEGSSRWREGQDNGGARDRGRDHDAPPFPRDRRDERQSRPDGRGRERAQATERDRDREMRRDWDADRERGRDRDVDRDRDKVRERDPDRDRGRERDVDRDWDRGRERAADRDWDRGRERDADRDRDRPVKHKEHSRDPEHRRN